GHREGRSKLGMTQERGPPVPLALSPRLTGPAESARQQLGPRRRWAALVEWRAPAGPAPDCRARPPPEGGTLMDELWQKAQQTAILYSGRLAGAVIILLLGWLVLRYLIGPLRKLLGRSR